MVTATLWVEGKLVHGFAALSSVLTAISVSMVLNPDSKYYADLKMIQADVYEDTYYDEDALFLERNSRDFAPRIEKIDRNTEIVCDWFWDQLQSGQSPSLQDVCYTKFATPDSYLRCIRSPSEGSPQRPGWGGLFSIVLKTEAAGRAFYDALACEKGPSLGTNFTLACPYTLLAHWSELEWASDCGVPSNLVRISVGLEDPETLLQWCKDALAASDAAMT